MARGERDLICEWSQESQKTVKHISCGFERVPAAETKEIGTQTEDSFQAFSRQSSFELRAMPASKEPSHLQRLYHIGHWARPASCLTGAAALKRRAFLGAAAAVAGAGNGAQQSTFSLLKVCLAGVEELLKAARLTVSSFGDACLQVKHPAPTLFACRLKGRSTQTRQRPCACQKSEVTSPGLHGQVPNHVLPLQGSSQRNLLSGLEEITG